MKYQYFSITVIYLFVQLKKNLLIVFCLHTGIMAVPGYALKNRRTLLERAEKFISPIYFSDINLRGKYVHFPYNNYRIIANKCTVRL